MSIPSIAELSRRNVFKVAFVYIVAAALLYWLSVVASTQLELPWWTSRLIGILFIVGFAPALIFAWVYEITPYGLKKAVDVDQTQSIVFKTGQKLNASLAVLVVLAAVAMIADRLLPELAVVEPPPFVFDAPTGPNTPAEIRSFTLDNGLKIIVWPDHDIPNVVLYNYVRAGGRNEYPGITGLSHFFEHMMFNGTANLEPKEFDQIMEAAGGSNNAYTTKDVTVYQDWFPKSAIRTIFELEADRLENLDIDPVVVESERGVVFSERRTNIDNDNTGLLYEQTMANAYIAHPYQFPVYGWPSDVENWSAEDLESYFRTYYAPNNCVMVFTGDVTPEEVYSLAEEFFGGIPAQEPPEEVTTVEPAQQGVRRFIVERDVQTPLLHVAFHAGRASDPETLAMNMLLEIVVAGDSSRLHRLLVEELELATYIGGFHHEGFDPSTVYFYLGLRTGVDPAEAEAALMAALKAVIAEGVTEAELAKARNVMLADFWRGMATIDGKASALGDFEIFHGSYERLFDRSDAVDAMTVEDLKAAAADVFRINNATIGVLQGPAESEATEGEQ